MVFGRGWVPCGLAFILACGGWVDQAAALSGGQVSVSAVTTIAAVDSNNCAGGAGPHAMFLQVRVTNTSGGALSGLTATLNGFPASAPVPPSPPTAFTLDLGETTSRSIGTLANGASASLYWYVNYPCTLPPRECPSRC